MTEKVACGFDTSLDLVCNYVETLVQNAIRVFHSRVNSLSHPA